jgi:hypothetical protein
MILNYESIMLILRVPSCWDVATAGHYTDRLISKFGVPSCWDVGTAGHYTDLAVRSRLASNDSRVHGHLVQENDDWNALQRCESSLYGRIPPVGLDALRESTHACNGIWSKRTPTAMLSRDVKGKSNRERAAEGMPAPGWTIESVHFVP